MLAVSLMAGAVALTWFFLTGKIGAATEAAYAEFTVCGQGIRPGGDVKLRGVLVGRIGTISRSREFGCRIKLDLIPSDMDQIPANVGAQIRAKTVFGEKWVELLYPDDPDEEPIAADDVITSDRTIDPLEVETILNIALPLLDAIDPENLAAALNTLAEGFVGHEEAAIRGMEAGIEALQPLNRNIDLVKEGIRQLDESGEVFDEIDKDLLAAMANLDELNKYTADRAALIDETLSKTPVLLNELTLLFESRFVDLTKIVDRGATVIGVLASKTDDLDRLLDILHKFNSRWVANLNAVCRFRQATTEPGASKGDALPGRCWRVHNIISTTQGGYQGKGPRPNTDATSATPDNYSKLGLIDLTGLDKLLYAPALLSLGSSAQ